MGISARISKEYKLGAALKKMSNENKKSTSKNKKGKEVKLTAAEKRRIQRERERRGSSENDRFAAFETTPKESKTKSPSRTDQSRFSVFDVSKTEEEKDDYFEKLYGDTKTQNTYSKRKNYTEPDEKSANEQIERSYKRRELTKKQRKTRTIISYAAVFTVVVLLAFVLSLTVMFKTTEIVVKGENIPYSNEQIISTSGLSLNENIFLAKRKAAVKKIVDKYPYIESAEVTFRIPGTQIITVETAIPSYQVAVSEGFAIVSAKGRVLEIANKQRANIPLLKGLKLTGSREGEYINFEKNTTQQILNEVINNINENEVPNIYGIDISNSASIKLNYDNRITILLGMPEDVGYKLRTAMAIINKELAATDRGDLDVSLASSDRKSSYFTPIYSNTVDIDESTPKASTSSIASAKPNADTYSVNSNTIKSAEDYLNELNSGGTSSKQETEDYNVDFEDIIEDDNYYNEEEYVSEADESKPTGGNIISDYGTNYIE